MSAVSLGSDLSLIDLCDSGFSKRTGSYVFHEEKKAIIETSASPSVPFLLNGLKKLGIAPDQIEYVIVTHIHLDHSGGAGLFLQSCPNAKLVVHPKGARHLADPSRLIQSAKMVYGTQFDLLFDPILPVPADRIIEMEDGGELDLGGRVLKFIHTPGHAEHHFSIYDQKSNGVFTGDTAGVQYAQLTDESIPFYMPVTSPNQFDPEKMKNSIQKLMAYKPDKIFYGHYGMTEQPEQAVSMVLEWLESYLEELKKHSTGDELEAALMEKIKKELTKKGVPDNHSVYKLIATDLQVSVQGMMHFKEKQQGK